MPWFVLFCFFLLWKLSGYSFDHWHSEILLMRDGVGLSLCLDILWFLSCWKHMTSNSVKFSCCLIIFSLWLSLFSLYWILIYKLLGFLDWCSNFTFSLFPSSLSFLVYDFLNFVFQLSPDVPYFFKYFSVIHSHNIYIYVRRWKFL